jgi:hypothetical protein
MGLVVVLDLSQCYREGLEALGVLLNLISLPELLNIPGEFRCDGPGVEVLVDAVVVLAEARGRRLEHAGAVLAEARRWRRACGRRRAPAGAVPAKDMGLGLGL